jgi:hypothetical protein
MTESVALERQYLQAVLAWLDARLEYEVRRWQLAGQNPADRFRGLYVADAEALELTRRGAGTHWGTGLVLPDEVERALKGAQQAAFEQIQTLEAQARDQKIVLRLKQFQDTFALSSFEWWAFIVCLAPGLDLRYERIYSYLQDDVTRVSATVDLLLNLLLPEGPARLDYLRCFDRQAPLRFFRLLLPVEEAGKQPNSLRQAFQIAPGIVGWLMDAYSPAAALGDWAEFIPARADDAEEAGSVFLLEGMPEPEVITDVHPMLSFYGEDFLQQELTARRLALALGKPLLKVKFLPDEPLEPALEKLFSAVRDARMLTALLYLQGCDVFIDREGCLLPASFAVLKLVEDCLLFSSKRAFKFSAEMPGNDTPLMRIAFERLSANERAELWAEMLEGVPQAFSESELGILAGQFALSSGQIIAAASSAMSQALQENRALQSTDLFDAARLHSGHHLAELAHKIEPRYQWDDLVLPETPITMLRELVSMVQSRPLVLETWGLGRKLTAGTGISALFSGPPGTGKTLAAQIMANQLGIDLYRIDLSTVVSKYVGETEKNLERIFSEASESNAILFFDEADTIFGKRSEVKDAHDRYANLEVGYLLQRMENYNGVAILATNLRANLDEAFTRRLQFIVNFPFPDEEYRLRIWQVLLPPDLPLAGDLDLRLMAARFKLAGGSIRNILVSAAYLAAADGGRVTMSHLLHGAKREIQKMGKLLKDSDFVI